jgi:hypothetical protein
VFGLFFGISFCRSVDFVRWNRTLDHILLYLFAKEQSEGHAVDGLVPLGLSSHISKIISLYFNYRSESHDDIVSRAHAFISGA